MWCAVAARATAKARTAVDDPNRNGLLTSEHDAAKAYCSDGEERGGSMIVCWSDREERAGFIIVQSPQCEPTQRRINYMQKVGTKKEGHARTERNISDVNYTKAEQMPKLNTINERS